MKKKLIEWKYALLDLHAKKSYSQEGEDMILNRLFGEKPTGFYVDVGAHHPKRFSNTYFFYSRGWHGINIDAMPGSMKKFSSRKRDINLEVAISSQNQDLTYYMFNDPALNGFDANLSQNRERELKDYHVIGKKMIRTRRLSEVLDEFLPKDQTIDFLSIDVEGLDLEVLQSNDWKKYRPTYVLVELLEEQMKDPLKSKILQFMDSHGYEMRSKTMNTAILKKVREE